VTQTVWLRGEYQRRLAHQLIYKAPQDAVVKVSAAKRSDDQNAKMWAMLSDISRAAPKDRHHIPEFCKYKFMATMTKKKSMSKNIGKYVVKKTVTVTKTIKKRK